eukprot:96793_1
MNFIVAIFSVGIIKADISYVSVGVNKICRGPNWDQIKPYFAGRMPKYLCEKSCNLDMGCTAYDTNRYSNGETDCYLFYHGEADIQPGDDTATFTDSGCYKKINVENYFSMVGNSVMGMCRGENWNSVGPRNLGRLRHSSCALQCEEDDDCTGYDLDNIDIYGRQDCWLFYHNNIVAQNGGNDNRGCFKKI